MTEVASTRPDEERQPVPGQSRCTEPVDRDNKVQPGQDRGEAGNEHAGDGDRDIAVGIQRRERRIEGPAGINASSEDGEQRHRAAQHKQIPAQEIEPRKGEVAGPDHERHNGNFPTWLGMEEIRKDNTTMMMPWLVRETISVHVGADQIGLGCRELNPDRRCSGAADKEEEYQACEIENCNALVIRREKPRS